MRSATVPRVYGLARRAGSGLARGRSISGAIAAQFSQAIGSFLLTVAGIRALSEGDFGILSLLLGALVLATALMTGFVGDSLTVLDRANPRIRAALEMWAVAIAAVLLVVGALGARSSGVLGTYDAALFGLCLAVFTLEDTVRRMLMANFRFWSVVVVDGAYLLVAALVLGVAWRSDGRLALTDFLLALVVGQVVAASIGWRILPNAERSLTRWKHPAMRHVAGFGAWRALQQGIRPAMLTIVRILVIAAAGSAALGSLESARVYMSPALLLVQGTGGYLLARYAADRHLSVSKAIRSSDTAALSLVLSAIGLGVVALLLLPVLGPILTGGAKQIDLVAAAAWAASAAAVAATMPYASLGAVRGRQMLVVTLRFVDASIAVALVGMMLFIWHTSPGVALFAVAGGGFVGAVMQRYAACGATGTATDPGQVAVT